MPATRPTPPSKAGAASLALDLLDDGTTTRDTFRIADELDALGARISTGSSLDLSFVRLQALSRKPRAVARPSSPTSSCNPSFPQDMVELAKKRRLAQIGQEKANAGAGRDARRAGAALRRRRTPTATR